MKSFFYNQGRRLSMLVTRSFILSKHKQQISVPPHRHILIIELGGFGDALYTLPLLRALKKAHPKSKIEVVCRTYVEELFNTQKEVHQVHGMDKDLLDCMHLIKHQNLGQPDLILLSSWSLYANLILLSFKHSFDWCGYTDDYHIDGRTGHQFLQSKSNSKHIASIRQNLAHQLQLTLPLGQSLPFKVKENPQTWEACCILFSNDHQKSLSLDQAKQVIENLLSMTSGKVLLLSGPDEQTQNQNLFQQLSTDQQKRVSLFIAKQWSLTAQCLCDSRIVLSIDTGAMHLAAQLHRPLISFFKNTSPENCRALPLKAPVENFTLLTKTTPLAPSFLTDLSQTLKTLANRAQEKPSTLSN